MFKLKQTKTKIYRHVFEEKLEKEGIEINQRILDYLFDDYSDFTIKYTYIKKSPKTMIQRLNAFWVYPLFILSIPFTYILIGDFHVNSDSKYGLILTKLLGEYY